MRKNAEGEELHSPKLVQTFEEVPHKIPLEYLRNMRNQNETT